SSRLRTRPLFLWETQSPVCRTHVRYASSRSSAERETGESSAVRYPYSRCRGSLPSQRCVLSGRKCQPFVPTQQLQSDVRATSTERQKQAVRAARRRVHTPRRIAEFPSPILG